MADLYKIAYYALKKRLDESLHQNLQNELPDYDLSIGAQPYQTIIEMVNAAERDNRPLFQLGPDNADVEGYTKNDVPDEDDDND